MKTSNSQKHGRVTVVIPVHNEEDTINDVVRAVMLSLDGANFIPKILLVDDGSTDQSLDKLRALAADYQTVSYISLSRNFGKEAALIAGIRESGDDFDYLAYMDGDGQHDPADLLKMLDVATGPVDLVCGARVDRSYQSRAQRWMARRFYGLFRRLSGYEIEEGLGDFNVLKPSVVEALRSLREQHIFMKGLIAWIGYRKAIVPISVRARAGGAPKSSTINLVRLAAGALFSFSAWPLRAWSIVGVILAIIAIFYLLIVMFGTIIYGRDIPGYASTIVLLLGLGGASIILHRNDRGIYCSNLRGR